MKSQPTNTSLVLPRQAGRCRSGLYLVALGLLSWIVGCGEPPADLSTSGAGGTTFGAGGTTAVGGMGSGVGGTQLMPMDIPEVDCPARTNIYVTTENNYTFSNTMDIQHTVLKDATDLVFDWSQVTVDFFGKPVTAATDIDLFLISLWKLTPEQIEANLSNDHLPLESVIAPVSKATENTITSANLLSFDILGEPLVEDELWQFFDTQHPDFVTPQDQHSFLVTAQTGTQLGKNARMLHIFTLDPNATQTSLTLTNDSTELSYQVELETAVPFQVPASTPSLTMDWSYMDHEKYGGTNALGNPFSIDQINEVVVAHFPSATLAQLETDFLSLEETAASWFSGEVKRGVSLDLSSLTTAEGVPFAGIDGNGIWMAALFCHENCNNPAPWSITVLEPCGP